jgi:hypothetical protein
MFTYKLLNLIGVSLNPERAGTAGRLVKEWSCDTHVFHQYLIVQYKPYIIIINSPCPTQNPLLLEADIIKSGQSCIG